MKKSLAILSTLLLTSSLVLGGCGSKDNSTGEVLRVYNCGEYIAEEVIPQFEKETGIEVVYDTYETNEEMYPIIEAGGVSYDVLCTSDYMIEKMIANDLLTEIDFSNIQNMNYVDKSVLEKSKTFDPKNTYSVPYTYGTLGILYNKSMVTEPVDSWNILWDKKYKDNILMYNSVRDLFVPALVLNGDSINTTDEAKLQKAKQKLIEQKPLLQRYVMDQIKDIMISGSAKLAMAYSGEVLAIQEANEDIAYAIPKEGTNYFIDSWVIPKNTKIKAAEAWINYINKPEVAYQIFEYTTYATANTGAQEKMDESLKDNPALFPSEEIVKKCEVFHTLGTEGDTLFNNLWLEIKGASK
ncbi:ABC transporter, periplasmic spermidine putrescine-binding protein PotD [Lachnospiraceae bacterium TWA4]|nr:ABC transporter, periplasmic spermidine putrescine-binding protein PotD [Lachnospiraceae bacterium TWA4]